MKKRILVAPLNWGIGHATRCIPIIHALLKHGFEPVLASDGAALLLLKKEFPKLTALSLASYKIRYSKSAAGLKWALLKQVPNILRAIKKDREQLKTILKTHNISGVISDNRFGLSTKEVPCAFITHQLRVLSGSSTRLSSKLHQYYIKKFDACWVPDYEQTPGLSGIMGHLDSDKTGLNIKYIGPLSRLKPSPQKNKYDIMVLLSGPEPQRSILEKKLFLELKDHKGSILFVKGQIASEQLISKKGPFTIYNFMQTQELEAALNTSEIVISRSGYTTIMDLAVLQKKAFFIPTPGQFEQEYLAKCLIETKCIPSCKQADFSAEKLKEIAAYSGFDRSVPATDFKSLFGLFESE